MLGVELTGQRGCTVQPPEVTETSTQRSRRRRRFSRIHQVAAP